MASGGRSPPAADYAGAAREQGLQNLASARLGAELNRVNQVGPTSRTTYSQDANDPDRWTQTTALTPEQQALYMQQTFNQQDVANVAGNQLIGLRQRLLSPFRVNGPERISSVDEAAYRQDVNAPSVANTSVDLSGIPGLSSDFSGERQRVEDALYGSATKRLDDQFGRADEANRTQLLNQGLREGSEGWNNAMRDFSLSKQDAYGDARDRAIAAGGAEQSRLYADALRGRQQSVGETFDTATFGNQAAQQQFQNEAARTGIYNQGQDAAFGQGSENANLSNAVRDAAMREQLTVRNQPLQEFLAMYGDGGGGTGSTGGNIPQVAAPAPADYQGAMGQQYADAWNRYSADEAQASQTNNGLIGIGTMAALYF